MTDETPQQLEMQTNNSKKDEEIVYKDPEQPNQSTKEEKTTEERRATLDTLADLEDDDGPIFEDSTHKYLIYYEKIKSKGGFLIGLVVLAAQISMYAVMADEPRDTVESATVPVEMAYDSCGGDGGFGNNDVLHIYNITGYTYYDDSNLTRDVNLVNGNDEYLAEGRITAWTGVRNSLTFVCEANDWELWTSDNAPVFILGLVLIWCFTAPDFFSSIAVMTRIDGYWSKICGLGLLFEVLYAVHICNLNLFAAIYNGNRFDAILNTVGVLFIHDMDEAMFTALKVIDKKHILTCLTKGGDNRCMKFFKEHIQVFVLAGYMVLICIAYSISRQTITP